MTTAITAAAFADHTTDELVAMYNDKLNKAIKKGSYTRAKMIDALVAYGNDVLATAAEETPTIEIEPGVHDANPIPAPMSAEQLLDADQCPLCAGDAANQTAAGAEGTVLGDTCNFCHECGKTYSCLDGSEVDVPASGGKKKRKILNPQVKIDAKTEACAKEGIECYYDKFARVWTFTDNTTGGLILHMDSKSFSEYSPAELAAYAKSHRPE